MIYKRKKLKGIPISSGIVLGHVRILDSNIIKIPELVIPTSHLNNEIKSLDLALEKTISELKQLREAAGKKMGNAIVKIFDAQLMIATDIEFLKQVKEEIIRKKRNAGFIYHSMVINATAPLKNSPDEYMKQMAKDIEAVSNKIIHHLAGTIIKKYRFAPNTILVGKYVTPGDVLNYRKQKAIGFLVQEGGKNSHMALITRALLMPVVLYEKDISQIPNNSRIILDGTVGEIIINPTDDDWTEYQKLKLKHGPVTIKRIKQLKNIPPVSKDGKIIQIASNLSLPGPADDIISERKIPVGLYRTEFLYLAEGKFPDEETQYQFYNEIANKFKDTSVILRTFDLGYDKLAANSFWPNEDNPALGWRGIRPMLELPEIFKVQLRAILRASIHKNLKIMLPMITDISEIEKTKKLISQVKLTLRRENIPFDENIELGIMVEIPSAALLAASFAPKIDFISIGTNDLTQYTLAADRINNKVASLYSPLNPAVLKLIKLTIDAGKNNNIPVSICGEIAGDILTLPLFIGMGIDVLSMNPNKIFDFCRTVNKMDSQVLKLLSESVLKSNSTKEVINKLKRFNLALDKKH